MKWLLVWILASAGILTGQSVQELEKRYWASLESASAQLAEARKSYQDGKLDEFHASLAKVPESVIAADQALRSMGKDPSKSPKHFKRAELKMREILRKLKSLEEEVGYEERPAVKKVTAKILDIHENLLLDIMGRRK